MEGGELLRFMKETRSEILGNMRDLREDISKVSEAQAQHTAILREYGRRIKKLEERDDASGRSALEKLVRDLEEQKENARWWRRAVVGVLLAVTATAAGSAVKHIADAAAQAKMQESGK